MLTSSTITRLRTCTLLFTLLFNPFSNHFQAWQNWTKRMNERDYLAWMRGDFVPSPKRLQLMKMTGLQFPEDVQTANVGDPLLLTRPQRPNLEFLKMTEEGREWLRRANLQS